jgi:hypothetical protein
MWSNRHLPGGNNYDVETVITTIIITYYVPNLLRLQILKQLRPSFCHTSLASSALRFVLIQQLKDSVFRRSNNFF